MVETLSEAEEGPAFDRIFDDGFQLDEFSMSEGEKADFNEEAEETVYWVQQPFGASRKLIHFKHVLADAALLEELGHRNLSLPKRYWKNTWDVSDQVLKDSELDRVPEWPVSRGWLRENTELAEAVVKIPDSEREVEDLEGLDAFLRNTGYLSDAEESVVDYNSRLVPVSIQPYLLPRGIPGEEEEGLDENPRPNDRDEEGPDGDPRSSDQGVDVIEIDD